MGATENAGVENVAPSKMHGWKTQEWKRWHEVTRVENAGVENAARDGMEMRPFNTTVEFS